MSSEQVAGRNLGRKTRRTLSRSPTTSKILEHLKRIELHYLGHLEDMSRYWTDFPNKKLFQNIVNRFKEKKWLVLIRPSLAGFDSTADNRRQPLAMPH